MGREGEDYCVYSWLYDQNLFCIYLFFSWIRKSMFCNNVGLLCLYCHWILWRWRHVSYFSDIYLQTLNRRFWFLSFTFNIPHFFIYFAWIVIRAELMKKSNGIYFPEEVVFLVNIFNFFYVHIRIQYLCVDNCEHCSETLQVVHATTTGSRISTFKFRPTSWSKSMCTSWSLFFFSPLDVIVVHANLFVALLAVFQHLSNQRSGYSSWLVCLCCYCVVINLKLIYNLVLLLIYTDGPCYCLLFLYRGFWTC